MHVFTLIYCDTTFCDVVLLDFCLKVLMLVLKFDYLVTTNRAYIYSLVATISNYVPESGYAVYIDTLCALHLAYKRASNLKE